MSLAQAPKNQQLCIVSIPSGDIGTQLLRFGLCSSAKIRSIVKSFGTITIQHHQQELAIGRDIAKQIQVVVC
jgi:Fe2+ transport system protein FeoA